MELPPPRGETNKGKDEENPPMQQGNVREGSGHRRIRSMNSITLTTGSRSSGMVSRAGLLYQQELEEEEEEKQQDKEQDDFTFSTATCDNKNNLNKSKDSGKKSPLPTPRAEVMVTQLVDEARISLNEVVDDAKASLEEFTQSVLMRRERKYRRSLRWYGSAANISNETMVPATFHDIRAIDEARCILLDSSRRLNPVDLVWRIDLAFTASILPRVVRNSVSLLVFSAYAITALSKRLAYLGGRKGDQEDNTVVKLSIFVSFIIVFYSNHCYTRFYRQYESVKLCCLAITDLTTMARSMSLLRPNFYFKEEADPQNNKNKKIAAVQIFQPANEERSATAYPPKPHHPSESNHHDFDNNVTIPRFQKGRISIETMDRLWRYMNAAHAAGYCGLSPTYTFHNLFEPFITHYKLLTQAEINTLRLENLDVEDPSGAYFHELVCWALSVVSQAREAGEIQSPNETVAIQDTIMKFRSAMQSLFDERFQEIPFAYSHLVSFICTTYLVVLAIDMGLKFGRKEPIASGLIFPALAVFFTTVVLLGLLYLGKAMSQPTGLDPEAFPIFSYLESTCLASRRLVRPRTSYRDFRTDDSLESTQKSMFADSTSARDESVSSPPHVRFSSPFSAKKNSRKKERSRSSSPVIHNPVIAATAQS